MPLAGLKTPEAPAPLGFAKRAIRTKQVPDSGPNEYRKVFPREVKTFGDVQRNDRVERVLGQKKLAATNSVSSHTIQK